MAEHDDEIVAVRGPEWMEWLKAIGIGNPEAIGRLVIDLDFEKGSLARIYVSRFGTRKLMVNPPSLTGAEIVIVDEDDQPGTEGG